jgi:hypothetical protein
MKAILEFDLNADDEDRFKMAAHSLDAFSLIHDIDVELRQCTKYNGDKFCSESLNKFDEIRQIIADSNLMTYYT